MKITAAYTTGVDPTKKKDEKQHPRSKVDAQLAKNYPGRKLQELDDHNVPVVPGVPDSPAITAIRRGHKPSIESGPAVVTKTSYAGR